MVQNLAAPNLSGIARDIIDVSPDDNDDLPNTDRCIGLRITTGGVLKLHTLGGGSTIRTVSAASGEYLPVLVTRVLATDTTATGIQALYS